MATPPQSLFELAALDSKLNEKISDVRSRYELSDAVAVAADASDSVDPVTGHFVNLLLTFANGDYNLPEQKVTVEYLRTEQKLVLPYCLGMGFSTGINGEVPPDPLLAARFWKVAATPYEDLERLVATRASVQDVRRDIDARAPMVAPERFSMSEHAPFTAVETGPLAGRTRASMVWAYISNALQFNCDIRDCEMLNLVIMRVMDDAWKSTETVDVNRLAVKLHPYTLQRIAAMNLKAVGNNALAAWTRAYGVAVGLMPSMASLSQREYRYSKMQPTKEDIDTIINYERDVTFQLYPLCLNLLAMFGLFHLNKDHTFRTNDANMERIGVSYLNTLRTMVPPAVMDYIRAAHESLVRTAQHPFGLAQTYWLALQMRRLSALSAPLTIRTDVAPPPVQRLYLVMAAANEWMSLPAGKDLNDVYAEELAIIRAEVAKIDVCPPRYSGLHALYAETTQAVPSAESRAAANALMPSVFGFANAMHVDEASRRDGIALALSLQNVERTTKASANMMMRMWETYVEGYDRDGLVKFVREARHAKRGAVPPTQTTA